MRMTPAYPTNDRCLDVPTASQALADHGRNCHRLADQWRLECKKAKELGQKPPLPPQARKRQEAAEAKKKASALAGGPPASKAAKTRSGCGCMLMLLALVSVRPGVGRTGAKTVFSAKTHPAPLLCLPV